MNSYLNTHILQTIMVITLIDTHIFTSLDTGSLFKVVLSPSALTLVVFDRLVYVCSDKMSQDYLKNFWPRPLQSDMTPGCLRFFVCFKRAIMLLGTIWAPGMVPATGLVIILVFSVGRTGIHTHTHHIFKEKEPNKFIIILFFHNNTSNLILERQAIDLSLSILYLYLMSLSQEAGFQDH